jgi:hypothetical protein
MKTKKPITTYDDYLYAAAMVLAALVFVTSVHIHRAHASETPIYDKDGHYAGSVHDYGKTQTYTDRNGRFVGSAINNCNGTTSFYGPRGNFTGSAGLSIDRAFNFKR